MNSRRISAACAAAALALAAAGWACSGPAVRGLPNLLLLSIDTLRPDRLGCYGHDRPTSPAIDRLAAQGVLFEDVTATSPWTLPSHATLLTGLYPNRHGLKSTLRALPEGVQTLAETLREHGYATAAVVNAHYVSGRYGFDRGFERFVYLPDEIRRKEPTEVEARALEWLSEAPREPFFLFLHFYDVHSDYHSLEEYERMFVGNYEGPVRGMTQQLLAFRKGRFAIDERGLAHLLDLYDAGIRQLDDGLARLLEALRAEGLMERTLVVLTSDHGEEFLEHGSVLHGRTQFDEVLRVPLIFRGPGLPSGRRVRDPASLVDVLPTALSALGLPVPDGLDGTDLSAWWRDDGSEALRSRFLYADADHKNERDDILRAVRYGNYKLINNRLTGRCALYDLEADPGERVDVADRHPELAKLLKERLDRYMGRSIEGSELPALSPEETERLGALGYL